MAAEGRRGQSDHLGCAGVDHGAAWQLYVSRTWHIPLLRSLLLWSLWQLSGRAGSGWVRLIPWVQWLWHSGGVLWPWLRHQPEWQVVGWLLRQVERWLTVSYLGLALSRLLRDGFQGTFSWEVLGGSDESQSPWALRLGCVVCGQEEPWVEVVREEDGGYTATLCGHFTMQVAGDDLIPVLV